MKTFARTIALAATLLAPAAIATTASASPAGAGLSEAARAVAQTTDLLTDVQYRHWEHRRHWRGHRHGHWHRGYGPRPYYGSGWGWGPRCRTVYRERFRPGWGWVSVPVRVCR